VIGRFQLLTKQALFLESDHKRRTALWDGSSASTQQQLHELGRINLRASLKTLFFLRDFHFSNRVFGSLHFKGIEIHSIN
jgi:hypothetical protein